MSPSFPVEHFCILFDGPQLLSSGSGAKHSFEYKPLSRCIRSSGASILSRTTRLLHLPSQPTGSSWSRIRTLNICCVHEVLLVSLPTLMRHSTSTPHPIHFALGKSSYLFRPPSNVFGCDRRRIPSGYLEVLRKRVEPAHFPLTFSFTCPASWGNIRLAELFSSASLASSSSHLLVVVSVRCLEHVRGTSTYE